MRGLLLLLLFVLLAPRAALAEGLRATYEIDATVSNGLDEISGSLQARVRNETAAPLDELVLWLYPNTFAEELQGVTDANRVFYAPFASDRGGIVVDGVTVAGTSATLDALSLEQAPDGTAHALRLPAPLAPGAETTIRLDFTTRIAHRLGPLSHARGVLTALGGWSPWLTAPEDEPFERLPGPADWRIRLRLPEGRIALVGGELPGSDGLVRLQDRTWADLVVRPATVPPLRGRGGAVWPIGKAPRDEWEKTSAPDPAPFDSIWNGDELSQLLAQMDRWGDAQPRLPDPGPIDLVVVPLRSEIALPTSGIVAVSDRAFTVTGVEAIQAIHARGIARAYFARRFLPLVEGCERPAMIPLVADALGARYAERFVADVYGGATDVRTVLGPFDFIPNIDDFLRSPRAPFAHVYFQPVADPIHVRDEPWTFNHRGHRGKLLFAKLEDWIGPEAFDELLRRYVQGGACPLQRGAEEVADTDLEGFFHAWTTARPREDLRVSIVSTEELPGGDWRSVVEVRRVGDAPPEVIETAAWEEDGDQHLLVWRAKEGEAFERFEVVADRPIERLRVDPRGRVAQTPAQPGEIAALGDRVPLRIQVLITRFAVSYSTADDSFFGDLDILLRPREAVRRRLGIGASYRKARLEARTSLSFGFGPLVGAARYAWNWGIGLSADYLRPGFGGEEVQEGFAVGPSVGISFDNRPLAAAPLRGTAFSAGLSLSAGANRGGESSIYGGVRAGALRLFPLGSHTTIALRIKGNVLFGAPPVQELVPLGGSDEGLRGFPLESVLSQRRTVASAEFRHPIVPDMDIDFGLARLRRISGAVFVDGAFAADIFPLQPDMPSDAFFADAGYGLRLDYDLLGVRPLTFAVDAAIPFNRGAAANVAPVVFSFRAGQSFSSP